MEGTRLEPVDCLKYLGVWIDNKLSWRRHLNYLEEKMNKKYYQFVKIAANIWGIASDVASFIYHGAMEPAILYACEVWHTTVLQSPTAKSKLRKLQRLALLRICKAYRTVSFDALCIIGDVMPIDLKAQMIAKMAVVKKSGILVTAARNEVPIQTPLRLRRHPAQKRVNCIVHDPDKECDHSTATSSHQLKIFTDGSKSINGVGCAFVVYHQNVEAHHEEYQLPTWCSVYQAELTAIEHAIRFTRSRPETCISIFSDSRAAILAVKEADTNDKLVQNIHSELRRCSNRRFELHWIKAHANIDGNERADQLAKDASVNGAALSVAEPLSFAKHWLKTQHEKMWNQEWTSSTTGRWTKQLFPNLASRRKATEFIPSFVTTQFATNHGKFNDYLHRFVPLSRTSETCKCGHAKQDAQHIFFSCDLLEEHRRCIKQWCRVNGTRFDDFLDGGFTEEIPARLITNFFEEAHRELIRWENEERRS